MTNQNLIDDERQKKIKELTSFHKELKSYKRLLDPNRQLSEAQKRYKESLREKLVRKSGALKEIIIKLTGWEYADGPLTGRFEIWGEAFNETPLSANEHALAFCIDAVNEAIGKLESMPLAELEAQEAKSVISESPFKLFDTMHFHPKVIEASRKLFNDGHYRDAIFRAFTAVNNFVKEKSGLSSKEIRGMKDSQLMAKVFDVNNPIIKLNELITDTDISEQEGFKFLFMGATIGIRNPKAHDNIIQTNPFRTLEYLSLASLLMKRVEEGVLVKISPPRKKWNLQRFLVDTRERCKQDVCVTIAKLYDFTKNNSDSISWGKGAHWGSFTFRKSWHGIKASIFTVSSDSSLSINFGQMLDRGIEEEALESLRIELNRIPDIKISKDAVPNGKYPDISVDPFVNIDHLNKFQEAILSFCLKLESTKE